MQLINLIALALVSAVHAAPSCSQNAGVFFFSLGSIQATVVRDGPFILPVSRFSVPDDAVARSYAASYRCSFPFFHSANPLLLHMPYGRVLVDTGALYTPEFPPYDKAGKLVHNLRAIGIEPDTIQHIVLTHAHVGHSTGLVDRHGVKVFPNATVYVSEKEHQFWFPPDASINGTDFPADELDIFDVFATVYRRNIKAYLDDLVLIKEDGQLLEGIGVIPTPGHTPGHIAFNVTSDGESLLIIGDAWLSKPDQVQHPEWLFGVDTGREAAYESRIKLMQMAVRHKLLVHSFHESFPGLGYIQRDGAFFDWVPMADSNIGDAVEPKCGAQDVNVM